LLCTTESRATGGTGYTLTAATDDSAETYDATGKLLSTKQRNGWLTTLTYSDATTPAAIAPRAGLLISVKNQFGRELKFSYDTQGRIAEVLPPGAISGQPAGSAISPIRYVYNEAASLASGVPAQSQLTSIVWQDGSVRRYHHEDGRWPQAVTGITDEAGVRYGTYAYDAQGRVTRSELAGGAERLDFAYTTDASGKPTTTVTDYTGAGGAATARTYTFTDIGNVRYPVNLTAPCSLCGSTQQSSTYDANGNPTRQIAHDGSVTFLAYDARGRETERAVFPASYNTAATRPALANATRVVSTQWHATFNLPTQVAEPNKTTANTYNSKGMLTGQSWTATTDATGAAKFTAVKTGSTYATGWSYSASNLATTVIEKVDTVETKRWTMAYATNGDLTRVTDVTGGNRIGRSTSYDVHGRVLTATEVSGRTVAMTYTLRGSLASEAYGGAAPTTHEYNSLGFRTKSTTVHGDVSEFRYDAAHRVIDVLHNGKSLSDPSIVLTSAQPLWQRVLAWMGSVFVADAHAQVLFPGPSDRGFRPSPPLSPGVLNPGAGEFDRWLQEQSGGRSRERDSSCERSRDRDCDKSCDLYNPEHRGRIQAQDNAPTLYEDSVAWAKCEPYRYIEAVFAVDNLMARMPPERARTKYRMAPLKAKRYFYLKSLEGGVSAFDGRSFKDDGQPNARIDAEVRKGKAYVP
jgi:YD repeat-containing protein